MTTDPVKTDQSKFVGDDGRLRYSVDGSDVYPGPTGVRRFVATGERVEWDAYHGTYHGTFTGQVQEGGADMVLVKCAGFPGGWIEAERLRVIA